LLHFHVSSFDLDCRPSRGVLHFIERAGTTAVTSPFATLLREKYADVVSALVANARAMNAAHGFTLPEDEIRRRSAATLDAFIRALAEDPADAYTDLWRQASYARFKAGVPIEHMHVVVAHCNSTLRGALRDALDGDPLRQMNAMDLCVAIGEDAVIGLHTAYRQAQNELIEAQRARIKQLSTPILPVVHGILVAPLIGAIDAERAGDILERLLDEIARRRAAVVILDVTGVPAVDAEVAGHLLRAARASELLGARVVFVGIGPETARAMVDAGADLGGVMTLTNLEAGIAVALRARGLAIRRR
jgi:rsbT co-antagonist protein RsbR